ncbi:MAG TPA: 30S ribosome-binding factor RbfA [Gammaproteobacteria bacterium]|nr:30S ribosome-binding factor RbfA [Gammaproteobacteria bacterium]
MPREHARSLRVAAQMQRLLNELLLSDVKDPRLGGARVSDVEVSGDLGVATVYFNTLGLDEDPAAIKEGFEQARGFFRSRVAQALQLRRVPELRFRHDSSAKNAADLGRLIDDASRRPTSD